MDVQDLEQFEAFSNLSDKKNICADEWMVIVLVFYRRSDGVLSKLLSKLVEVLLLDINDILFSIYGREKANILHM